MPLPAPIHCAQLFFDGRCSLCAREMALLRKYKRPGLVLVDIHTLENIDSSIRQQMLLELHMLLSDGQWLRGVDASVSAWSFTRFGFLLQPLRWKIFAPLVDKLYKHWAARRYCNLYGECSIQTKEVACNEPK